MKGYEHDLKYHYSNKQEKKQNETIIYHKKIYTHVNQRILIK